MFNTAQLRMSPPALERLGTGLDHLDELLEGGVPLGQLVEVSGGASSGKATLAFSLCLRALSEGQAVAWIGPRHALWPLPALEARAPLDRLLVVQLTEPRASLRAAQLILACPGAVAVLVLDWRHGAALHNHELVKLQRLAERAHVALLMLTERAPHAPSIGGAVGLRLHVRRAAAGTTPRGQRLTVEVLRHKWGAPHRTIEESVHGTDRLRVRSSL